MSADKVSTVSDMLVQTQNKGKVTVGELASSMGKIIPTANASNVSLEQLCAGYAIMTSKGIAAAETTTYMNSMLNELSKSGSTTDKLLRQKMGGSFAELMASGKTLGEILGGIQEEASKSGLALSDMFSSSEAGKAAMSLLSNGVDGFNSSVQDMVNSVGGNRQRICQNGRHHRSQNGKGKEQHSKLGYCSWSKLTADCREFGRQSGGGGH